jgi:hypothetical protein
VRDCANEFEFITSARDAIESGKGVGPRLILAGFIDGEGPNTNCGELWESVGFRR